jgi:tetratricopeptide (TPR) repeat protein
MKEKLNSIALPQLEAQLEMLDVRVAHTEFLDQKARILSLAGDLCFDAVQPERALVYYENAINTYTRGAHYEHAMMICRKVVALTPEASRMYSKLAWLALVRGMLEEARERIGQFARVADAGGFGREARTELLNLSETSDASEVLEAIGDALLHLEDSEGADRVFARAYR